MTIHNFANQIEQLNSYLRSLPELIKAIKMTKSNLVQLLLKMCPPEQQGQYCLTQGNIPLDLGSLFDILKQEYSLEAQWQQTGRERKVGQEKCKVIFKNKHVRKNARSVKRCYLCKKHGGAHMTHTTAVLTIDALVS